MHDLIVIGGGPAGLTAAAYALRRQLDVILVSQDLGGKTNYTIRVPWRPEPSVIRGAEVVETFWQELDAYSFARRLEPVTGVIRGAAESFAVTLDGGERLQGRSIVYATGARVRRLDVPGEREFLGRGVSYSALSHAHLFVGKTAVVVGNGPRALHAVAELANRAAHVHWVAPEPETAVSLPVQYPRSRYTRWANYKLHAVEGDAFVQAVILVGPDGVEETVPANGVFVERGLIPNTDPVQSLVELDENGHVKIDHLNHTSCPGFFAAGDVTNVGAEQILIAVGEGARAALSAIAYVLPAFS